MKDLLIGGLLGWLTGMVLIAACAKSLKDEDRYYKIEHRVRMLELKGEAKR